MSVYRTNRKNKPWGYRWRDRGKHHSRSFRTKAEAIAFQGTIVGAKYSGTLKPANRGSQKFELFAREWLKNKTRQKASTKKRHLGILVKHVFPVIGDKSLNHVNRMMIQEMVSQWSENGLKPRTVIRHVAVISAIFSDAVISDLIDKSPIVKIEIPEPDAPHRRPLSVNEFKAFITGVDPLWRPHFYLLTALGLRWSELANLEMRHWDRLHNELIISEAKTKAGIRKMKLTEFATELIERHLSDTNRVANDSSSPLFVGKEGFRLNYANFRKRVFKPGAVHCGIPELQLHDLRRTAATLIAKGDISAKEVQEFFGHEDIRTTFNIYVQSTEEGRIGAAELMESILDSRELLGGQNKSEEI